MPVLNFDKAINLANRIELQIHHFARGTYPEADGKREALPVNRFFLPLFNPHDSDCYIADDQTSYALTPGNAYFIPIYHPARVRLDTRLQFLSVQFTYELYAGVDLFSQSDMIRILPDPRWMQAVARAYQEPEPHIAATLLVGLIHDLTAELLQNASPQEMTPLTCFAEFRRELEYIRNHCLATTTVEELAAIRGVRREVFSRNFSNATGITPKQFLTRSILNRACRLLRNRHCLSKEVAFELGFSNEFYFSRFFKKNTGLSPHRFQQLYTDDNKNDVHS